MYYIHFFSLDFNTLAVLACLFTLFKILYLFEMVWFSLRFVVLCVCVCVCVCVCEGNLPCSRRIVKKCVDIHLHHANKR
jgi:membrane protein required for beta-lactamase induction